MNPAQRAAIRTHRRDLVAAFPEANLEMFLMDLREAGLINADTLRVLRRPITITEQVINLFELLQAKDHGWRHTIEFLEKDSQSKALAKQLLETAGELP